MTRPCALCHRPIPEGESHRMVAFGLVVHASVLQCGRRTAMSDARADMLKSFGYPTADTVARAQAYHDILTDLIAQLRDPDNYSTRTVLADNAEARLREVGGE